MPKDGRTLLKTKTTCNIETLAGGLFHYFEILCSFHGMLNTVWSVVPDRHSFKLQLNFDGSKVIVFSFGPFLVCCRGTVRNQC